MPIEWAQAVEVRRESGLTEAVDAAAAAADARHAFLRRAWFAAAADADAATLVAARGDGRVAGALPVVRAGPRLLRLRAVPGCYWPFRSFPLALDATDAEVEALLAAPAARQALGRVWRLGPVPADDPTLARLLRAARAAGFWVLRRSAGTEFGLDVAAIRQTEEWPRPSTLRNMHKHRKRLSRLGEVGFRYVSGSGWSSEVFEALERIERNSWVGRSEGADAKFLEPRLRRGWETMVRDPALADMLSVGILSIAGEPVAFSFGLNCGRTRYCVATSYDARFAKHSPGYLTGYLTYIEAVERGIEHLSLGAGDGGEKSSMGAVAEAELVDCLFVRGAALARLLSPFWRLSARARD